MIDVDRASDLREAIEDLYFGYRAFTALPDAILAERGLARTHHRVLYFVSRDPGITLGALLTTLQISKQALHRPLKELEERGLIRSAADDADRRIRRLSVTDAGAQLEAELSAAQMRLLDEVFTSLDPAARRHWHQVMQRLASTSAAQNGER